MKDDPEQAVGPPPATSSPPFVEAHAEGARMSEDPKGRLIVAAVKQDKCKCAGQVQGVGQVEGNNDDGQGQALSSSPQIQWCHLDNNVLMPTSRLYRCQAPLQVASWGQGEVTGWSVVGETRSPGGGQRDDGFHCTVNEGGDEDCCIMKFVDFESHELMSRMDTVWQQQQQQLQTDEQQEGSLRQQACLGFSAGVNNALFVQLHVPHWLIANYNIVYTPMVLDLMGRELERARVVHTDLVVHTYSCIYGRGKVENHWSNFVMTSCTVARIGVWDKNIFPVY
jgi:hypothetical protein